MSTTLAQLEQAYYKAIHSAKVTGCEECHNGQESLINSRDAFLKWARKLDIYDLKKEQADFSLDKETRDEFGEYRREVEDELRTSFQYVQHSYSGVKMKGTLENIGSSHDGSKVEKMDEVDSFYVLEGDIVLESADGQGNYRLFCQNRSTKFEIKARSMRNQFADACGTIVSNLSLPKCLRHGGYNSPTYSGLRYNGPAATSQFLTKDNSLLTWDMTPAFCVPRTEYIYHEVRQLLHPILDVMSDKMLDKIDIHLIPDGGENLWRLSTAHLEANILRILPTVAPVKQALSYCKILFSKLKTWNAKHCDGFTSEMEDVFARIMKELGEYVEGSSKRKDIAQHLNKELRYAHIWIPHEKRKLYNEDQKAYLSINNAAVKYILLNAALEQPEAFSDTENMNLVIELMKQVFEVLGDTSRLSSPHTFLKMIDVPHLSILASQEKHKIAAGLLVKEQCRTLLLATMTTVGNWEQKQM